ncbi:MAG: glutamine--fructose-6-phosphate transaminase (isomerizing) [Candidatus Hadarchaeota archaeon]
MCGIVGYVGKKLAAPVLLESLKRLEYRGYDSTGIATISKGFHVKKEKGKIAEIDQKINLGGLPGKIGIGHTRWATHGVPSKTNAHPHIDNSGKIAVVHNGIIENYEELRNFLLKKGYKFTSETDTEVIPNLISYFMGEEKSFEAGVREALKKLKGSFALGIISTSEPEKILAVRRESPLIVGVGKGEMFLASDIPAILQYTKKVITLEDDEMAVLTSKGEEVRNFRSWTIKKKQPMIVKWTVEMAEKMGYPHFTLKEIMQQPDAIRDTLRADPENIEKLAKFLLNAKRVYIVACGTSYHAALVAKYAFAKLADFSVEPVISSEFQESCRSDKDTAVLAITQSGETADTLKAVRVAKTTGARIACLTNVVGSSITRESELVCYTYAGPEISVVATKTFAAQVSFLLLLAAHVAKARGLFDERKAKDFNARLLSVPSVVHSVLSGAATKVKELATKYKNAGSIYLIGRGIGYPIVLEGALKLKEITYIHSEALPAGELKHGTLALIEKGTPLIAVVPPGESRARMIANIEEVKARGAKIVAIANEGDDVEKHADEFIAVSPVEELFSPLPYIAPLQLLAYHITVERGQDPDRPRSLAKSVTVE